MVDRPKIELTDSQRRAELLKMVIHFHGEQRRKYSDEPYWFHVLAVANIAKRLHDLAWEIAVCHDLLEDTYCTRNSLYETLKECGYSLEESVFISEGVIGLTDVYEKKMFPDKNRVERKTLERKRLSQLPSLIQSIKYADMIHNTQSIVADDKNFAKVYLREINDTLEVMREGDFDLFRKLCYLVQDGFNELSTDHDLKIW